MSKRKITDPFNVKFEPFDNYGSTNSRNELAQNYL